MTAPDLDARFVALLARWLAGRPSGRDGTAGDLFAALDGWPARKGWEFVPGRSALARTLHRLAGPLAAAGWRVACTRTAAARTLAFVRAG